MTADLRTIARLEFVAAVRLKWVRLLGAAFALIAAAAAYASGAANDVSGSDEFARTTMTLVPLSLILVPLAALVLGISGQAVEQDGEPFLFAQPVGRATIVVGRWVGQAAALGGAIVAGLGVGAAVVGSSSGPVGVAGYALFVAASVVLALIFLSIAAVIAASTPTRAAALSIATFVWFFFVLLYDGAALSLASWITGPAGSRILFASVFGNPADLVRVVTLLVAGTPNVLGAAGDAWLRFLGGSTVAPMAATVALTTGIAAPLIVGVRLMNRRDL